MRIEKPAGAEKPAVKVHAVDMAEIEDLLDKYCPDKQETVQIHAVAEAGRTEAELQALLNKYSPAFHSNDE